MTLSGFLLFIFYCFPPEKPHQPTFDSQEPSTAPRATKASCGGVLREGAPRTGMGMKVERRKWVVLDGTGLSPDVAEWMGSDWAECLVCSDLSAIL